MGTISYLVRHKLILRFKRDLERLEAKSFSMEKPDEEIQAEIYFYRKILRLLIP
jgi:hypothetical protein